MPINCFSIHNSSSNFHLFLDITKSVFKSSINTDDNFKFCVIKLKSADFQIIEMFSRAGTIGIDPEKLPLW
ncbi:hypothetical protein SAMN05428975_0598 [Mucilaginibacter sp. OK268]|nr:hypothetical protein SAMN05428975_0598 [Mucilaginibacter sp. OK268]